MTSQQSDFEGFVDGVAFEGGKGTDYPLTLGSGSFIPGFEDQLVGARAGDRRRSKRYIPGRISGRRTGWQRSCIPV